MSDSKPIAAATLEGIVGARRVTLYGVLVFFLFMFGALFVGFVMAHLFPATVMSVVYGVRSDTADLVSPSVGPAPNDKVEAVAPVQSVDAPEVRPGFSNPAATAMSPVPAAIAFPAPAPAIDVPTSMAAIESPPGAVVRRKPLPPVVVTQDLPPLPSPNAPSAAPAPPPAPAVQASVQPWTAPPPVAPSREQLASTPPRVVPRQKPMPPAQALAPAPQVPLGSFVPKDQLDLAAWARVDTPAGHFDAAVLARTGDKLDGPTAPKSDDLIDVHGWAGDRSLGLRFESALISMCGKVVARARVGDARPDVARAVHPNLTRSGWKTRLAVAHLPRCSDAQLQAWGVVPGAPVLVPLAGGFPLNLPPPSGAVPPGAPSFQPKDVVAPKLGPIAILVGLAELRQCGSTDCAVAAQAGGGSHQGYVADQAGDWALVILGDRAGWLPRAQFRAGP